MLTLEDYVSQKKKKAKMDEFDLSHRDQNLKACVDFIFDYFTNYLNEETALKEHKEQKLDRYKTYIQYYSPDLQEWLTEMYAEHGNMMERIIGNDVWYDEFFLLYDSEDEFERLTNGCYNRLVGKYPFLKDSQNKILCFIKQYHKIRSYDDFYYDSLLVNESINEWQEQTWVVYHVNVFAYCYQYIEWFSKELYRNQRGYNYNLEQSQNLFNIDLLFKEIPKKPFVLGRKKEFEIIMMYFWLNRVVGDDSGFWNIYLNNALQTLPSKDK